MKLGERRAVSILTGENVLFCGLYPSLLALHCSPWWLTTTQPVCCADSGWMDSLPDLSAYTNTVSQPTSDLSYMFVPKNPLSSSVCVTVQSMRQQNIQLEKPQGLKCCELSAPVTWFPVFKHFLWHVVEIVQEQWMDRTLLYVLL